MVRGTFIRMGIRFSHPLYDRYILELYRRSCYNIIMGRGSVRIGCSDGPHSFSSQKLRNIFTFENTNFIRALWLSGYSDRLEIYFLREQEFESLRRRYHFCIFEQIQYSFWSAV
jgi:hypothetical protein